MSTRNGSLDFLADFFLEGRFEDTVPVTWGYNISQRPISMKMECWFSWRSISIIDDLVDFHVFCQKREKRPFLRRWWQVRSTPHGGGNRRTMSIMTVKCQGCAHVCFDSFSTFSLFWQFSWSSIFWWSPLRLSVLKIVFFRLFWRFFQSRFDFRLVVLSTTSVVYTHVKIDPCFWNDELTYFSS